MTARLSNLLFFSRYLSPVSARAHRRGRILELRRVNPGIPEGRIQRRCRECDHRELQKQVSGNRPTVTEVTISVWDDLDPRGLKKYTETMHLPPSESAKVTYKLVCMGEDQGWRWKINSAKGIPVVN